MIRADNLWKKFGRHEALRGLSFSDEKNGWLVGGFGLIYRTTDGGKNWLPSQG